MRPGRADAQLRAGIGGDDLRLDGHQAAVARLDGAERDALPHGHLAGRLAEEGISLRIFAQVGQHGHTAIGGAAIWVVADTIFMDLAPPSPPPQARDQGP